MSDGLKDGIKNPDKEISEKVKDRVRTKINEDYFCYDGDLMYSNGDYYVPDWAIIAYISGKLVYGAEGELFAETRYGLKHVNVGDCICKCDNGDLFVIESKWIVETEEEKKKMENNMALACLALDIVERLSKKKK